MLCSSFRIPSTPAEAFAIQNTLREKLILRDDFGAPETVAGVDVGYHKARGLAHASVVVLRIDDLTMTERAEAFVPAEFPYVPGLLSFREIPAILAALAKLSRMPDMLMVDGQGIAHPRRMGIAAHLGVLLDCPAIGVGKSRLAGNFIPPGPRKGDCSVLTIGDERVGTVLRSREKTNPLFISPGHRIGVESALDLTLRCITRYRLPEPTRLADKFSKCARE